MIPFAFGLIVADTITYLVQRPPSPFSYAGDFVLLGFGLLLFIFREA